MKFYDTVKVTIHSGKGGDGIVAARREAKIPYGGPAGGNGGKGGTIVFVGNKNENTLLKYIYHRDYRADDGKPGQSKEKYGADGGDRVLSVPLGTIIKDTKTGHILHQIVDDKEERIALSGGEGGVGNMHFKTSTLQFPEFAILGEPGKSRAITLELHILGDVALIGTPSVGKSTLINACSNAKAKVAAYHFTTLVPNLGMVSRHGYDFAMVDIPGLIEGAHDGKGLGNAFLRHILKAHVFCFVQDLALYEKGMFDAEKLLGEIKEYILDNYKGSDHYGDPVTDVTFNLEIINDQIHMKVFLHFEDEKKLFLDKLLCFVFNKFDLIHDEDIVQEYMDQYFGSLQKYLQKQFGLVIDMKLLQDSGFVVSGATRYGLDGRLDFVSGKLRSYDFTNEVILDLVEKDQDTTKLIVDITDATVPYLLEQGMIEEADVKFIKVWEVNHSDIIRASYMTMWGNDQGEHRFWRKVQSLGFSQQAEEAGIKYGDIVKFSKGLYNIDNDRYIQWML